jgi:cation diffusion facilitator CzcD-associated flavoprotein CzcO
MSFFEFEDPIRRVAIVGGGPSGIPAARHLRDAGLEVLLFEQQPRVGGVWNYDEHHIEQLGESSTASLGTASSESPKSAPWSTPCYWNLTNNVPTQTMAVSGFKHAGC